MSLDEPRIFSVSKRGHGAPGSSALEGGGTPPAMEADWHIGGKSPLTVMAQQLMLQGTKSDYNDCLRVELYLPRACPVMEVKLNLSQIISLALWRS